MVLEQGTLVAGGMQIKAKQRGHFSLSNSQELNGARAGLVLVRL